MVTVDSKGRIVLPKEVRDRLGLSPGTEVGVHAEGGRIVVEPEEDPEEIIDDIETLVENARTDPTPLEELADPFSKDHLDAIRRGVGEDDAEQ